MTKLRVEASALVVIAVALFGCAGADEPVPATAVAQRNFAELDRELLSLLQAEEFDKLESVLAAVISEHVADRRKERQVDVAYDTFYRADVDLEEPLANWIQAKPDSYSAHLARGAYYTSIAWVKRGGRYAHLTSDEQFAGMRQYFARASTDLAQARRLNPNAVRPIAYQMEALINDRDDEQVRRLYEEALRIDPTSVTARWQYLWSLLPRWGGSIQEMERVVMEARPYYAKNPELRVLEGRVEAELGDQAFVDHDCNAAKAHYDNALKAGEHSYYLGEAAHRDYSCGLLIADVVPKLRRAIALRPNVVNIYPTAFLMGHSLYGLANYGEAIQFLSIQLTIDPNDHKTRQLRGDSFYRLGRMDLALADFQEIVQLAPENQEYQGDLQLVKTIIDTGWCTRNPQDPQGAWVCKEE